MTSQCEVVSRGEVFWTPGTGGLSSSRKWQAMCDWRSEILNREPQTGHSSLGFSMRGSTPSRFLLMSLRFAGDNLNLLNIRLI